MLLALVGIVRPAAAESLIARALQCGGSIKAGQTAGTRGRLCSLSATVIALESISWDITAGVKTLHY